MKGLKYVSLWNAQGYAESAARYLAALAQCGVALSWHPMHFYGAQSGLAACSATEVALHPLRHLYQRPIEYDTVLFHVIPHPALPVWLEAEADKHRLISTAWETDRLPADWPAVLNAFERVLVPSEWNRRVCLASGVHVPVRVVPYLPPSAPDPAPAEAGQPAGLGPPWPADRFVFYTIGEWTRRKALEDVLTAYWQAFTAADPVLLLIKTTRLDLTRFTNLIDRTRIPRCG